MEGLVIQIGVYLQRPRFGRFQGSYQSQALVVKGHLKNWITDQRHPGFVTLDLKMQKWLKNVILSSFLGASVILDRILSIYHPQDHASSLEGCLGIPKI